MAPTSSNRIGFGERPAVLVIDFTKAFTDPCQPLGADLSRSLHATHDVLDAARLVACPIVFTRVCYDDPQGRDAGVWGRKVEGARGMFKDSYPTEIDPRSGYITGDVIVTKKYPSAFFGTDLITRLQTWHTDTLLLMGCSTSGCVRATAVDGLQYGYRVMVIKESVADRDPTAHAQSLHDLDAKYADVVTVTEATAYLSRLREEKCPPTEYRADRSEPLVSKHQSNRLLQTRKES